VTLPRIDPHSESRTLNQLPLRDDNRQAAGKIAVFQYATVAAFVFLIFGFWRLQVQNVQYYDERALANSVKSQPMAAPRGRILDRDGRLIVDNHSSFRLLLTREALNEAHLAPIARGLDLDLAELQAKVRRYRSRPKYDAIVLKELVTPADLSFVDSHRDFFPELLLTQDYKRAYPQNGMLAHVIGYTGEISEQELDMPEFAKYDPGTAIGKFGIEREYNDTLAGVDGQRQVVVDNRGQVRQILKTKPATSGKDLELTIDLDLQAVAELAMEGRNGAVVALDPRTGEVLAMVSRPAFDLNKFADHIKSADWKAIMDNPDHPMMNRAIQSQLAPGSTFKPIMALAGLETGTVDMNWTVHCAGGASFYGGYHKCHKKTGHGAISLHNAIVNSCDVFFYTLGDKMGINPIAYYANMVGFGHPSGIDLPGEASGIVPSPEWKLRNYREKWWAGETISVAIGQGALTVTPVQLARAIGGIAVGGVWHHPHLVRELDATEKPDQWALDPDHVKDVIDGMYGVVNEGGTATGFANLKGIEVCGKTGTAQVASADLAKQKGGVDMTDNAWFVGFAPRAAPEIVVVALWDHGREGYLSAPIVRDVLKAYFDKKARIEALRQQQTSVTAQLRAIMRLGIPGAASGVGIRN
jgi:penicillin-binding protein 2